MFPDKIVTAVYSLLIPGKNFSKDVFIKFTVSMSEGNVKKKKRNTKIK